MQETRLALTEKEESSKGSPQSISKLWIEGVGISPVPRSNVPRVRTRTCAANSYCNRLPPCLDCDVMRVLGPCRNCPALSTLELQRLC